MKKRYTEEQIIGFLKQADAGVAVKELCRKHGFSEASYYLWRSKFGGMDVSDAKKLKALESENAKLKKLLAETILEKTNYPPLGRFPIRRPTIGASTDQLWSIRQALPFSAAT